MVFLIWVVSIQTNNSSLQTTQLAKQTRKTNMSTTQFNPTVFMSRAFEKAAAQSATDFSIAVIHALADKYGFDAKEAMAICQISEIKVKKSANRVKGEGKVRATKAKAEPKPKREVPAFPLPFCGQAVENWCLGLRLNHGLHSQCTMERIAGGDYCKTCQKQCDKNASGKPTYGCVADRMACPILEYRDPKAHKQTLPFANVMTKLNITREAAEAEALKFGLTIPEEHFVERASRRGRPKKDASASDTDSESGDSKPKKRGRPKKEKKVIAASVGDDLIASLVASAKKASTPTPSVSSNSEEDADDASSVVSSLSSGSAKSTSTKSKKLKVKKIKAPKVKTPEQIAKEEAKAKRAAEKEAKLATLSAQHQELLTKLGRPAEAAPQKIGELTKLVSALKKELKAVEKAKKEAEIKAKKDAEALAIKEKLEKEAAELKEKEAQAAAAMVAPAEEEEEENDDDSTNVVEFKHGGVTYWKDGEGNLYDPDSQEQVGFWNKETQQVETIEEFGSDEDSSEDESED